MRAILTSGAPAPVGPYSQAVVHGELVFASGQIPLDPASGKLIAGEIEAQAERVLENLRAVLEAAGSSLGQVLRTTVYVTDLSLFARMNAVYARYFSAAPQPPARATVQVAALPLGALVEIDAIALGSSAAAKRATRKPRASKARAKRASAGSRRSR